MNDSKSSESGHTDDEKNDGGNNLQWTGCKSNDREYVNALLDISEEYSLKEQELFEVQSQGWEEAVSKMFWIEIKQDPSQSRVCLS